MNTRHWDIFCKVVDNFGDIGISWRLARELADEHGLAVRLWVDDLESFAKLNPRIDPTRVLQRDRGVDIAHWRTPFADAEPAEVVIEAFGCGLPDSYVAAMAHKTPRPVWVNLEYLSAERWIEGCHGLASPHPRLALTKYFFFPGFGAETGGLLREAGLFARRDAWQRDLAAGWAALGLPRPAADIINISLFGYDNPALPGLLQAWAEQSGSIRALVSPCPLRAAAAAWLGREVFESGEAASVDGLEIHALPFFEQERHDRLLWNCELNFVRGEDSLVRALWAARPLVWQPYPQEANTHAAKLAAFLDVYCRGLSPAAEEACRMLFACWNGQSEEALIGQAWQEYRRHWPELARHARVLAQELAALPELAIGLVRFCRSRYNFGLPS